MQKRAEMSCVPPGPASEVHRSVRDLDPHRTESTLIDDPASPLTFNTIRRVSLETRARQAVRPNFASVSYLSWKYSLTLIEFLAQLYTLT